MANEIKVWGDGRKDLWSFGDSVTIPDDYEEVPTGDPFITRRIKQLSETVYVRMFKAYKSKPSSPVSILAPADVVAAAREEAERTAEARAQKRAKGAGYRETRELRGRTEALRLLKEMLPGIPERDAQAVVTRTFEVGSGRVGRAGGLSLEKKLDLAVHAHIRHEHTGYDHFMMMGQPRDVAFDRVRDKVDAVFRKWSRPPGRSRTRKSATDEAA